MATPEPIRDPILERALPNSPDTERAILGAIILDNSLVAQAVELLKPSDFYVPSHRRIFMAMIALFERGSEINPILIAEELRRDNSLDSSGGVLFLTNLTNGLPHVTSIVQFAKVVRGKSLLRQLVKVANKITAEALEEEDEPQHILDHAEHAIFALADERIRQGFEHIKHPAERVLEKAESVEHRDLVVTGVPTGFRGLDSLTSGLQNQDLIVIAARPSMGKTSLALTLAQHAAIEGNAVVGIFSLEMSAESLAMRMLCSEASVDAQKFRSGYLSNEEWSRLGKALGRLADARIFIDDTPAISVLEMRAKARRLATEQKQLDLIVVDYLQLMSGSSGRFESRQQEVSQISRELKALAKELNIPMVALSQLSRAPENRTDHRPQLADLRECVTGDTLVMMSDGTRRPIRELVGKALELVSVKAEGRIELAQSNKVWSVGVRPVFRLKLASGRAIRATADHRLFGIGGWMPVRELKQGDRLAIARRIPEPAQPLKWTEQQLVLLGHLLGDGSYLSHQPLRYTTASEENSWAVTKAATDGFGMKVNRHAGRGNWHQLVISGNGNRWHPCGVNAWLRELGIYGQRSHEKRVPDSLFRLSNSQVALFLRHLWATDGSIWLRGSENRGSSRIYLATASELLAQDIAALLLRFGIVARLRSTRKKGYRPVFSVDISGAEQQMMFLDQIGGFGPRQEPAARLLDLLHVKTPNTNVDTLPKEVFLQVRAAMQTQGVSQRRMAATRGTAYGGTSHFRFAPSRSMLNQYAEILDDNSLRQMANSDLFWDVVDDISPVGEEEVFDLSVPGTSSWLADGIVSHNSGAIEQDADVVAFIYREEQYNKSDENKNIAELIVAKQRNGPTDTVYLAFLNQFAKFADLDRDALGAYLSRFDRSKGSPRINRDGGF